MLKLKKLLAVMTALALAVSMLGMVTVADDDDGYVFTVYINSIEDFLTFADAEDADNDGQIYEDTIYILNIDIDFSEFTSVQESYAGVSFPLFSGTGAGFAGMFDGNGHTIYNYNIESSGSYVGLFSSINGGTVKDLTITGSVVGSSKVGAIAGSITNGTISNCTSYVTVSGYYDMSFSYNIGGIVGYAKESTIENCVNKSDSTDCYYEVGGIVGSAYDSTISNCVNYSDVTYSGVWGAGGIVGELHDNSFIYNCSNYGDVTGDTGEEVGQIGGIAGVVESGDGYGIVDGCYNSGTVSGTSSVGGIVGSMTNAYQLTNCVNDGDVVGSDDKIGGIIGYALNNYSIENCQNNGDVTASGDSGVYYVGGIVGRTSLDSGNSCSVSFDYIIISGCSNTGDIYGNSDYIGGILGDADDIVMTDCYNTGSVSGRSNGGNNIGGVVGKVYGGSYLTDCYNEGTITGYGSVGGVVGSSAGGNVERCYNTGSVTGASVHTGGVVGYASGYTGYDYVTAVLKDSYNTGSVANIKEESGMIYVGGIAGSLSWVYCENCYNVGTVTTNYGHSGSAFGSATLNNSGEMLGTVSNVYYLDTSAESAVGSLSTNAYTSYVTAGLTSKTEEEFNSGEVTYLLNGSTSTGDLVWYQTVVTGENDVDQYPVLDDESEIVLQITVMMDDETLDVCYTNVDCILEEYPTSDSGELAFYYDEELTNEIDTATGIYSSDSIIYASYAPYEYNVSVDTTENGTVTSDVETAAAGDTVTLTVTPDEGYEISSVTVTDEAGNEVTLADDYTFTMPENDVTVTATFAEVVEDTAIWTETRDEWVNNGNYASLAFTLSDYCDNADEIVSGDNVTITVTVESDGTYFNGTIGVNTPDDTSESGSSWASAGTLESTTSPDTWTFTVDVASDYAQVQLWWMNSDCTYVSVTDISVTVNATEDEPDEPTEPTTYAVTLGTTENGTVTADVEEAEAGATVTLTVTPADGYTVSSVTVTDAEGNEVTVADDYTFTMPESDVTVSVVFEAEVVEPTTYTVTVGETENGTVTADAETAEAGATVTLTVTPDDGYTVSSVTVTNAEGNEVAVADDYTFTMPESDVTVAAVFEAEATEPDEPEDETYTITVTVTVTGGTATTDKDEATEGETVTITVTPADGYSVIGVTVVDSYGNTITVTVSGSTYSFVMPSSEVTITPIFEETSAEHTHTYVFSGWVWASDLNSAYGVFYCSECGTGLTVTATITSTYSYGVLTRTAAVYYDGTWYTDSKLDISSISTGTTTIITTPTTDTTETTTETIEISEPVEPTDTETEDDGETTAEATAEAETNPTTGIAISMIPMTIAALAAVSSKRR